MTTRDTAFEHWWYHEGSQGPTAGSDLEEHCKRMCEIAWQNGAYKALEHPEPVTEWLVCPKCNHQSPYSPIKAKTLEQEAARITKQARAALAQQSNEQVEPVAWIDEYGNAFPLAAKQYSVVGKHWKPLYTTPPQRKPLTHEQRFDVIHQWEKHYKNDWNAAAMLVYLVEAAHNIKE